MLTFFFFNDTATTEIYTLSLHDALPIYARTKQISYPVTETKSYSPQTLHGHCRPMNLPVRLTRHHALTALASHRSRSEEHTSELQSRQYLVCRLLLEKKKKPLPITITTH